MVHAYMTLQMKLAFRKLAPNSWIKVYWLKLCLCTYMLTCTYKHASTFISLYGYLSIPHWLSLFKIFSILSSTLGCETCSQFVIDNGVLPNLLQLLIQQYRKSIKKEACWTISNITAGNRAQIQVTTYYFYILLHYSLILSACWSVMKKAFS